MLANKSVKAFCFFCSSRAISFLLYIDDEEETGKNGMISRSVERRRSASTTFCTTYTNRKDVHEKLSWTRSKVRGTRDPRSGRDKQGHCVWQRQRASSCWHAWRRGKKWQRRRPRRGGHMQPKNRKIGQIKHLNAMVLYCFIYGSWLKVNSAQNHR